MGPQMTDGEGGEDREEPFIDAASKADALDMYERCASIGVLLLEDRCAGECPLEVCGDDRDSIAIAEA
jgi:hypothetical protein